MRQPFLPAIAPEETPVPASRQNHAGRYLPRDHRRVKKCAGNGSQQRLAQRRRGHRCPFWLVCLKNRWPWFRWGKCHLPGPSMFPKGLWQRGALATERRKVPILPVGQLEGVWLDGEGVVDLSLEITTRWAFGSWQRLKVLHV